MKHLPLILCGVIPHNKQRYNTGGDYKPERGRWIFTISKMDVKYEFIILIHELVEWFLCTLRGIKEKDISAFDKMWEKERLQGLHKDSEEPGMDKRAPYRREHIFATKIEHLCAKELGVDMKAYDAAYEKLIKSYK